MIRGYGILWGLVVPACVVLESGRAWAATDPELIEARRKLVEFSLSNPSATPSELKAQHEATVRAAERKLQVGDPAASSGANAAVKARRKGSSGKSASKGMVVEKDAAGRSRVGPWEGDASGKSGVGVPAVTASEAKTKAKPPGKAARNAGKPESGVDPSPLPFTGPRSMTFGPAGGPEEGGEGDSARDSPVGNESPAPSASPSPSPSASPPV